MVRLNPHRPFLSEFGCLKEWPSKREYEEEWEAYVRAKIGEGVDPLEARVRRIEAERDWTVEHLGRRDDVYPDALADFIHGMHEIITKKREQLERIRRKKADRAAGRKRPKHR